MNNLSSTRYNAFHRCRRFEYNQFQLGYVPIKKSLAQIIGTLIHVALEAWWLCWMHGGDDALQASLKALRRKLPEDFDAFALARLDVMMRGYHHRWAPEMRNIKVLAVEQRFKGALYDPDTGEVSDDWCRKGFIDVIIQIGRKIWLVEHKTTSSVSSPGSSYWTKLRMDPQISIYFDGAEMLGYDVAGCLYDVIGKPQLQPYQATPMDKRKFTKGKKCKACKGVEGGCEDCGHTGWKEAPRLYADQRERDETLDEYRERLIAEVTANPRKYYRRAQVVRLESELDEARRDLWSTAHMITANSNLHPPRNPDACSRFGGTCEYFDVCSGAGSLEDETKFTHISKLKRNAA